MVGTQAPWGMQEPCHLKDEDTLKAHAQVRDSYLKTTRKEKLYTTAGREIGENAGRPVLIVRAIYGLRSSGAVLEGYTPPHSGAVVLKLAPT